MKKQINVDFRLLNPDAIAPTNRWPDAGWDFYAPRSITVRPEQVVTVPLGIAVDVPEGYVLLLHDKSGLSLQGLSKMAGVIDSGYQGEVVLVLVNHSVSNMIAIPQGKSIIQGIIAPVVPVTFTQVEAFSSTTNRGGKGFGSTSQNRTYTTLTKLSKPGDCVEWYCLATNNMKRGVCLYFDNVQNVVTIKNDDGPNETVSLTTLH